MADHNDLGKLGEELAIAFFRERGHEVLSRNFRNGKEEIDLITLRENCVHFIEVKTRTAGSYGAPEDSVSKKKFRHLVRAAEAFLEQHPSDLAQFDILSITVLPGRKFEYFLIEDVFWSL